MFYGGNEAYLYPKVKGNVDIGLHPARNTKIGPTQQQYSQQPTLYTQTPEFFSLKKYDLQ